MHNTNNVFVCDHCAGITPRGYRYGDAQYGYYLLCYECSHVRDACELPALEHRQVNAFPDCVSAWEMMDQFGRVPFHVNPLAYTQADNYLALHVLPLCGDLGGDIHYYITPRK